MWSKSKKLGFYGFVTKCPGSLHIPIGFVVTKCPGSLQIPIGFTKSKKVGFYGFVTNLISRHSLK
jgi:hypothetical protein